MKDLIEGLQILLKYSASESPAQCRHNRLSVHGVRPTDVSDDDRQRLDDLGFSVDREFGIDLFYIEVSTDE